MALIVEQHVVADMYPVAAAAFVSGISAGMPVALNAKFVLRVNKFAPSSPSRIYSPSKILINERVYSIFEDGGS